MMGAILTLSLQFFRLQRIKAEVINKQHCEEDEDREQESTELALRHYRVLPANAVVHLENKAKNMFSTGFPLRWYEYLLDLFLFIIYYVPRNKHIAHLMLSGNH